MTEERPFSRLVRVDALPREGQTVTIEATSAERQALASFFELPAIAALTATLRLEPWGHGGARVSGAVRGALTQVCVVSLEPFPATIDEAVDVRFAPRAVSNPKPTAAKETFSLDDDSVAGLAAALARNVYGAGEDAAPKAEALANHVASLDAALAAIPIETFAAGRFRFPLGRIAAGDRHD